MNVQITKEELILIASRYLQTSPERVKCKLKEFTGQKPFYLESREDILYFPIQNVFSFLQSYTPLENRQFNIVTLFRSGLIVCDEIFQLTDGKQIYRSDLNLFADSIHVENSIGTYHDNEMNADFEEFSNFALMYYEFTIM